MNNLKVYVFKLLCVICTCVELRWLSSKPCHHVNMKKSDYNHVYLVERRSILNYTASAALFTNTKIADSQSAVSRRI